MKEERSLFDNRLISLHFPGQENSEDMNHSQKYSKYFTFFRKAVCCFFFRCINCIYFRTSGCWFAATSIILCWHTNATMWHI